MLKYSTPIQDFPFFQYYIKQKRVTLHTNKRRKQ